MAEATLKVVARLAGVGSTTVSRVVNGSERVAPATREKILAIIRDLDYTPNLHAANLRRRKLNDENAAGLKDRGVCLTDGGKQCASEEPIFSPEERRALGRQIVRLRRDLDRLREHTERIQTCVEIIQRAYSHGEGESEFG